MLTKRSGTAQAWEDIVRSKALADGLGRLGGRDTREEGSDGTGKHGLPRLQLETTDFFGKVLGVSDAARGMPTTRANYWLLVAVGVRCGGGPWFMDRGQSTNATPCSFSSF